MVVGEALAAAAALVVYALVGVELLAAAAGLT